VASYIFFRINRKLEINEKVVEELSILKDSSELPEGFLPGHLLHCEDACRAEFAFETEVEERVLDRTQGRVVVKPRRVIKIVPIIFFDRFIAFDKTNCLSEDVKRAYDFVSEGIVSDIVLEGIRFDSSILKKIIDQAEGILKAEVKPKKRGKSVRADKISISDRFDVALTEDWPSFSDEPLEAIKVRVPGLEQEARVGFNKFGVVTISNRNFSDEMYLRTLKYVVEQIVHPYVTDSSYQQTLVGFWGD